ncbi:hypothetical protein [Kiloniella sp.]|uniref:hypothetical protein n=1 Tax=Kiloniella sp. TaxID=1938587 RepID=UPI003B01D4EE
MSDLEELRLRVEAAEEHFGLITDQQKGYSQRLIALLNVTEQKDQSISKLEGENEQLRTMLYSLLQAIEKGDTSNTLQDMDTRISVMTGQVVDTAEETPPPETHPAIQKEELTPDSEEPIADSATNDLEEIDLALEDSDEADTQADDIEAETISDESGEIDLNDDNVTEENESVLDIDTVLNEVENESEELETMEFSESDNVDVPEEESEDALIAEIAENLELVLPDDGPVDEPDEETDDAQAEALDEEPSAEEFKISDPAEDNDVLEGLEDPLEDALIAGANENSQTGQDPQLHDPAPEASEEEEDKNIDNFLEENADEDEASAASPEIEDIMERISKQALSQNE